MPKIPPIDAKPSERRVGRDPRYGGTRQLLVGLVALALGGIFLWGLRKATAEISFDALVTALRATPPTALLGSLIATLVSFVALLGYDLSGLRYAGARPPLRSVLLASFCGFAIGNTVGLGVLSGGAVRYRLYTAAGLSPGQIARVILFISVAFGADLRRSRHSVLLCARTR